MSCAIGIDLGGTFIKYGLVDRTGTILYESIRPTYLPGVQDGVYTSLLDALTGLRAQAVGMGLLPEGIGIGAPAIIDNGILIGCAANLPDLEGRALGSQLEQQLRMPVRVENDATLMGLAEWKFGAARNLTDVIFLTIGTGIGGAMILDDKLYTGYRHRGGELGHMVIEDNGLPCGCGGKGCLEAHASVKALIEDYQRLTGTKEPAGNNVPSRSLEITGNVIISAYLDQQPTAIIAMNRHFDYLAAGITGLINIFAPQKLILGGGITEAGDFYIDEIRQRVQKRVMKETSLNTGIERAQLGNKAGFMGAAALVFNSF
ncbi:MAG: ROK family protein [Bacteroidota bacterium]